MAFTFKHGDRPVEGYTIQRAVGRGGFGEVYYAVSDGGKDVALKYLRDNPEVELRGVEACMNLKNPHLISIYDVRKSAAGEPFIVMEYVSGPSLRDLLTAEPGGLGSAKALFFLKGMCEGLSYLHDRGIVHRDLKPGNIFYDDGYVKIGDYGLSKFMSVSRHSAHTSSVGTVHYMAPEVGSGNYSRAIDVYAVGVMLFEMLTGRVPFEGASMGEVLMKHLTQAPNVDGLPEPFARVIGKALEKDPQHRYATVDDLMTDVLGAEAARSSLSVFNPELSLSGAAARGISDPRPGPVGAGGGAFGPPPPPRTPPPAAAPYIAASGKPLAPEVSTGRVRYAGFWIRTGAVIIDSIVLLLPTALAQMMLPVLGG
ncbi:MAG: serine/threonine protein kinase [Phycisphaerae bacterium]|nr:MAG: serine/threonine protein kinase [Phycisphaerae bacterium]